ncbi:hypothetical protein [Candidatus Palauibacter sp.]|uniref:hypothetical protein n=1 Tax=Candidatus Palauibacter sp. TaxID=3101350 RepID=UPI003B027BC1
MRDGRGNRERERGRELRGAVAGAAALFLLAQSAVGQACSIEFEGRPFAVTSTGKGFTLLSEEASIEASVKILRIWFPDDQRAVYLLASRDNLPLRRGISGIFTTYHDDDDNGLHHYVRNSSGFSDLPLEPPPSQQQGGVGYVEHLVLGLESITYYGTGTHLPDGECFPSSGGG